MPIKLDRSIEQDIKLQPTLEAKVVSDTKTNKYLILDRDSDVAPTPLIAEGNFLTRLYTFLSDDSPSSLDFKAAEVEALIHLAPLLHRKPVVVVTNGLSHLPGRELLLSIYGSVATDVAANRTRDSLQAEREENARPAARLKRQLEKNRREFLPPQADDDSKGEEPSDGEQ